VVRRKIQARRLCFAGQSPAYTEQEPWRLLDFPFPSLPFLDGSTGLEKRHEYISIEERLQRSGWLAGWLRAGFYLAGVGEELSWDRSYLPVLSTAESESQCGSGQVEPTGRVEVA